MPTPLNIWSLLYYLTEVEGITWRQDDWNAFKIIKALKGEPINGYFDITYSDRTVRRYTQSNVSDFLPVVFRAVADKLKAELATPFDIVPIPNSTATINDQSDCRIFEQARAIASIVGNGARVVPALRWKRERTPTHRGGGSRDPEEHFENLQMVQMPTQPCVLFDDVITSGSQMIGASRRLKASGIMPVLGTVVGRAIKEQKSPVMGWYKELVETESGPMNWLR